MNDDWHLPGLKWGTLNNDDQGLPDVRYAPTPGSVRAPCSHLLGNHALKVAARGDGRLYPFLFLDRVVSLCGTPETSVGAGRLFLMEGGRMRPFVGPDDPRADHSDITAGTLRLAPNHVVLEATESQIEIRRRVALPLAGLPAIVSVYSVTNRGAGARWVSLVDAWDLAPHICGEVEEQESLRDRLRSALRRQDREHSNNLYFREKTAAAERRTETRFLWDEDACPRFFGEVPAWGMPPIHMVSLTRNAAIQVIQPGGVSQELLALVNGEMEGRAERIRRLLAINVRFQPAAGETQVAAVVTWFGSWDEARVGLRKLLPVQMFSENEAILWRRRTGQGCVRRAADSRELTGWEVAWTTGQGWCAPQRAGEAGELVFPPGGEATFVHGVRHDPELYGAALEALSWTVPDLVRTMLTHGVERSARQFDRRDHQESVNPRFMEDTLWTMHGLATFCEAQASGLWEPLASRLGKLLEEVTAHYFDERTFGAAGLVTTRFADGLADRLHGERGGPRREDGLVESMAAAALLVRACERMARTFKTLLPGSARELADIAAAQRDAIESLLRQGNLGRWTVRGQTVGEKLQGADHLGMLLWMGLPADLEKVVEEALVQGRVRGHPLSPIWHAWLLERSAFAAPEQALQAFLGASVAGRASAGVDHWGALFGNPEPVPGAYQWPSSAAGIAGMLRHIKVFGLRSAPGGIRFNVEILGKVRLELPVLQLRRTGTGVAGEWKGIGGIVAAQLVDSKGGEAFIDMEKGVPWSVPFTFSS